MTIPSTFQNRASIIVSDMLMDSVSPFFEDSNKETVNKSYKKAVLSIA